HPAGEGERATVPHPTEPRPHQVDLTQQLVMERAQETLVVALRERRERRIAGGADQRVDGSGRRGHSPDRALVREIPPQVAAAVTATDDLVVPPQVVRDRAADCPGAADDQDAHADSSSARAYSGGGCSPLPGALPSGTV